MELDSASSPKGTWLTPSAAFYCSLPTPDGLLGCNPQTLAEEQEKGPPGCRPATVRPAWVSQELSFPGRHLCQDGGFCPLSTPMSSALHLGLVRSDSEGKAAPPVSRK